MHKLYLLVTLTICSFLLACSTQKKAVKKTRPNREISNDPINVAIRAARKGDYKKALSIYNEILKSQPNHPEILARRGSIYYELDEGQAALDDFEKILANHPNFDPEIHYSAGMSAMKINKFKEASEHFKYYIKNQKNNPVKVTKAKDLLKNTTFRQGLKNQDYNIAPTPIPGDINTYLSEYLPAISLDGNQMIFTRRIGGQEDLFIATKNGDQWEDVKEIEGVNTLGNEGAHTISSDGKTIIFTACDRKLGIGGCDLFSTHYVNDHWLDPIVMDNNVNTPAWDAQPCLSANGRKLIFCSNRIGGVGKNDLWMSEKNDKGDWMPAVNLGSIINTPKNEESPYLHPDGKTLYFRSEGHPGMGSYDLFISKWDDKTESWGEPVNMGPPINSEGNDGALSISRDGQIGYYASDINSLKNKDIPRNLDVLQFELPEHFRPLPVTFIKAVVKDASTMKKIDAIATMTNHSTEESYKEKIDPSGDFIIAIPSGSLYTLTIDKPGYKYYLNILDLKDSKSIFKPLELEVVLYPIKVLTDASTIERPLILDNIYFETGSAVLLPNSDFELKKLAQLLTNQDDLTIQIVGHTDNVGSSENNLSLSKERAISVKNALNQLGIQQERMTAIGKGETDPIADNATEEGRAKNRRTEIVFNK